MTTHKVPPERITLAKATALILLAHSRGGLPFPSQIGWGSRPAETLFIEFVSGADLHAWAGFFGARVEAPIQASDRAEIIWRAYPEDYERGWHGLSYILGAVDSTAPVIDAETVALIEEAVELLDAAAETTPAPGVAVPDVFAPAAMPTGDAENRATAAELRGEHHRVTFRRVRTLAAAAVDGGRGDAEFDRLVRSTS